MVFPVMKHQRNAYLAILSSRVNGGIRYESTYTYQNYLLYIVSVNDFAFFDVLFICYGYI